MTKRGSYREKELDTGRPERIYKNPAVRALLDHLAEELAKEYISLMKASGEKTENEEGV